jgi:lysophospholipase L1-like esterase
MKVLFIGDSLIEFYDWEQRFPGREVFNYGIAGETVEGLFSRLQGILKKVANPDYVFIMTGINNMAMGDRAFPVTYRKIIGQIKAKSPSSQIFVQSLLPVLFTFIQNDEIREINMELRKIAEEEDVSYSDIHAVFLDSSGVPRKSYLLDDGVHLSEDGYRAWSAEIEKLITTRASSSMSV